MKIFKLNDYEWWFAETLKDAYKEAQRQTGVSEQEQRQDSEPEEVPESKWDEKTIGRESLHDPNKISYREALALVTSSGAKCGFLCGTET